MNAGERNVKLYQLISGKWQLHGNWTHLIG